MLDVARRLCPLFGYFESFPWTRSAPFVKLTLLLLPGDAYCGQCSAGSSDSHVFGHLPQSHGGTRPQNSE